MSFFDGADFHSFLFCWNGTSLYKCYYANMLRAFSLGLRGPEAHKMLTSQIAATKYDNVEFDPTAKKIFRLMESIDVGRAFQLLQSVPSRQRDYYIWHHTQGENTTSVDLHGYIDARCGGNDGATWRMFTSRASNYDKPGTSGMSPQARNYVPPVPPPDPEYIAVHVGDADNAGDAESVSVGDFSDDSLIDLESLLGLSSGFQSEEFPWERDSDTSERQRRFIDQFEGKPVMSRAPDDARGEYMSARGGPAVDNRLAEVLDEGWSYKSHPEAENDEDMEPYQRPIIDIPSLDANDETSKFDRVRMWLDESENDACDVTDSVSDTDILTSGKRKFREEMCLCSSKSASNLFTSEREIPFKRIKLVHRRNTQDMINLALTYEARAGCSSWDMGDADSVARTGCSSWDMGGVDSVATRKRKAPCDNEAEDDYHNEIDVDGECDRPKRRRLVRYECA